MRKRYLLLTVLLMTLLTSYSTAVLAKVVPPVNPTKNFQYSDTIQKNVYSWSDSQGDESAHDNNVFYVPGTDPGSQRIHANYSANTDACAACHFTHSAPGTSLLQWGSVFEACAACHDGSLGKYTYDVFAGTIGVGPARTFGGLFGSTVAEVNLSNDYVESNVDNNPTDISNHMSNGYMALSAAPGAIDNPANIQFDCASCHTPHGQGGNARILNPDPGKLKIDQFFPVNGAGTYPVSVANNSGFVEDLGTGPVFQSTSPFWIQGYPYNRITGIFFVPATKTPDFQFNPKDTAHKGIYAANPVSDDVVQLVYNNDYTIDWRQGLVTVTKALPAGDHVWAVRVPGIFIAMKIDNILGSGAPDKPVIEELEYVEMSVDKNNDDGATDPNSGINAFCGTCHGKYNTQGNKASGGYDFIAKDDVNHGSGHFGYKGSYRHQVGLKWLNQWPGQAKYIKFAYPIDKTNGILDKEKKVLTCLGCHFAHGVNNRYWYDYVNKINGHSPDGTYVDPITGAPVGLQKLDNMEEIYGSSALKRLPNMGTCEDCHNKSVGNSKDTITVGGVEKTYY